MANKPNNPSLRSKAKSLAKQKFDVYPSAYANGWAAKWYKSKGGTWRKAMYGMEIPEMQVGGYFPRFMQEGGEPDGGMALGQVNAVLGKLAKLREFIQPDSDLEPWISSKLAVMDHYADAVYDEMMYGEIGDEEEEYEEDEEEEEEEAPMTENELEEMKNGGIPERYRKRGFTKVGVKRQSTRPGKKWMVLAKKGDQYKIVHGGYKGMKDFTQHRNKKRQKKFWSRMGGKNSSKATDPFSPLYWHKRFGTWEDGGQMNDNINNNLNTNFMNPLYDFIQRAQMGGMQQSQDEQIMQLIAMFAQMQGVDPEQVMAQLQQLSAEEQQQAIQQMMQAVQESAANEQQQMPAMRRGGMYQAGGSMYDNVMGGPVGLPAMPADIYGLPIFGGGGAMRGYVNNPYVEDMMEMQDGGKPEWLIRAQLKAQGFSGEALENKLSQMKQGGIHINPKNKGKFTAKAKRAGMGVQEYASKVLGAPEGRYPASTRRQANFARNAADWKKQVGGMIENLKVGDTLNDVDEETLRMLDQMGVQYKFV